MPRNMIRVRATDNGRCAFIKGDGTIEPGRFIGIDKSSGEVIAAGELVVDHPQVRRYIARGQLELMPDES